MPGLPSWLALGLAIAAGVEDAGAAQSQLVEVVRAEMSIVQGVPRRLVLSHWPAQGWIVRQDGRQVEIEFPGVLLDLEPPELPAEEAAFQKLTVKTSSEATYLRMGLGCDCTVAIRGDGRQIEIDALGVDLTAGPIHGGSGPAPLLAPDPPQRPWDRPEGKAAALQQARAMLPGTIADPPGASPAEMPGTPVKTPTEPNSGSPSRPTEIAEGGAAQDLEATRERLLGELRHAAESGLITLRANMDGETNANSQGKEAASARSGNHENSANRAEAAIGQAMEAPGSHAEDQTERSGTMPAPQATEKRNGELPQRLERSGTHPRLRGSTAEIAHDTAAAVVPNGAPAAAVDHRAASPFEEGATETAGVTAPTVANEGGPCLPNEAFALPDPLPHNDLVREIAASRRALTGEFDRPDPDAVAGLALIYIANGFGVEATQLLEGSGAEVKYRNVLAAMATLSEEQPLAEGSVLAAPGCTGQHALWQAFDAALAGRNAAALAFEAAAVGALEQVARGLRGRIAARIGLSAAAVGDRGATHRLLAMARRGVESGDSAGQRVLQLLAAEDDRLFDRKAQHVAKLTTLSQGTTWVGETALLALAAALESQDPHAHGTIDVALLDRVRLDLGRLAFSARGLPRGEAALLAEARLTARSRGSDAALALLDHGRRDGSLSEAAYQAAILGMADFAAAPNNTELALIYEAEPQRFAASLENRGFREALARSYAGLGAPALAQSVLRDGDLEDPSLAEVLAHAFLSAGEGEPARSLAALMPEGAARATVSAEAARLSGDLTAVLPALVAARASTAQRAAAAWSIADWDAAATSLREQYLALPGEGVPETVLLRDAARLAFAALQAGNTDVPEEARRMLSSDPAMTSSLDAMFMGLAPGAEVAPAEVPALLGHIRTEKRLLEVLLHDG